MKKSWLRQKGNKSQKKERIALFSKLNKEMHKTVLMVTHDMANVYTYCDDVVVLEKGQNLHFIIF